MKKSVIKIAGSALVTLACFQTYADCSYSYATYMSYCPPNGGCYSASGSCDYSEADHNIYCCSTDSSESCVTSPTTAAVSTREYSANCTGNWFDGYNCTAYTVGPWSKPANTTLTMTVGC